MGRAEIPLHRPKGAGDVTNADHVFAILKTKQIVTTLKAPWCVDLAM